ncbi:hypothetical protein ACFQ3K_06110, partial [Brucella gallinifaecis]|uniref:hypothetical protein n=1 Tax=Brucella gallinifaecis TaxID=215590 RepID=UPI00364508C4
TALSNLLNSIEFEFVGEISFTHRKLLASFLSHKVSTNLGAIQYPVHLFWCSRCQRVQVSVRMK